MLWSLASQVGKHWPQSRPASGHGQRWCPPGSQPQRQHCSAFCLQPALSAGTERFTEHRFCEGHGSHDSHPGRCCQSQVTGCGAAGTRTGHAQVLGRKHSTPSTSPSLEEPGWGQTELATSCHVVTTIRKKCFIRQGEEKLRATQCQLPRHCLSQASLIGSPDAHCPETLNQPEAHTGPTEAHNTSPTLRRAPGRASTSPLLPLPTLAQQMGAHGGHVT